MGSHGMIVCWTKRNPKRRIPREKYREILADQVLPVMQTLFPAGDGIIQNNNVPIQAAGLVQLWFDEQKDVVKRLPCTAQSPDLNIIEPLRLNIIEGSVFPFVGLRERTILLCRKGERGASSGVILVTSSWFKNTRSVAKSPRVAEQCDVNIHSLSSSVGAIEDSL
ncbi:DDE_3 domain-containing protein [Trichonephila clavipes]|nr:DDE_3 domain-containing protein [Trichonephila clavipes]